MSECEFKPACEKSFLKNVRTTNRRNLLSIYLSHYGGECRVPPEEHEACTHYVALQEHFNSPQFRDRFVDREGLVVAYRNEVNRRGRMFTYEETRDFIRTHGLKEG